MRAAVVKAPVVLTIAGSDPSGGAGAQADLKTFCALGVFGAAAFTSLTVQDTQRVYRVEPVDPALVGEQIDAVLADLPVRAVKTGLLPTRAIVEIVASRLARDDAPPLVVDPVLVATSGDTLASSDTAAALRTMLLPCATLVTPNLDEAEALTGSSVRSEAEMRAAARALCDLGARAALVKGGHLADAATDVLLVDGQEHVLRGARIEGGPWHGTGCTFAAAIAAHLASGASTIDAVLAARAYVFDALRKSARLGGGAMLLDHAAAAAGARTAASGDAAVRAGHDRRTRL